MQETARRRQTPLHLRSSPPSNQVCGAPPRTNSGQPVAFIECLGGRMCVILHYCPPPTKLWNKAGKTTSKIYPNGPFESLWTVSFLRNRMERSPATTTVAVSDFSAIGSHLYRHKMWYEWKWNHHNIFQSVIWNEANRRLVSESFSRLASQPSQDPNGAPTCHHPLHSTTNCICRTTNLL